MESRRPGCQRTLHKRWQQLSRYWAAAGNLSRCMKNFRGTATRSPSKGHTGQCTAGGSVVPNLLEIAVLPMITWIPGWCWGGSSQVGQFYAPPWLVPFRKSPSGYCKVVKTKRTCQVQEPWCFVQLGCAGMKYCTSMVAWRAAKLHPN